MGEIPDREQIIHTDSEVSASLERGLQQAADGETEDRGSFRQHLGLRERWRTRHAVVDTKVFVAVRRDQGHCSMTYANATGLDPGVVKRSLRRLVAEGHLRTEKHRHLDELPLVDIYHLAEP